MSNEISRSPYLAHNQVIIISEKLVETEHVGDVLDLFVRDPENRRASNIMVAHGEASKILEVHSKIETLPAQYIRSTQENKDKSESITPPTNIGELHHFLLSKSSYALPKISITEDDRISTSGAAVFNGENYEFKGFLDQDETTGRNMIQERSKQHHWNWLFTANSLFMKSRSSTGSFASIWTIGVFLNLMLRFRSEEILENRSWIKAKTFVN